MAHEKEKEMTLPERAKECLSKYQDRESDNIRRAEEAIDFRALNQWPTAIKQDRENPNQDGGARPCPVLDKTNQYIRQIINEERQSKAAIKIRPVDDEADPKVAEVFNGIIRHIEDASEAIEAYTTGGEHAVDGGFGFWRIITEYSDPLSFEQDILIKKIPNRFSVALGHHVEQDFSDGEEALIWEDMAEAEFKKKYPDAKEDGFEGVDSWRTKDTIRVAEYMYIDSEKITIYLLEDGQVVTDKPKKFVDSRESLTKTVKWAKVTDSEVLEETDMIGSYIPIIKVVGNELTMPDGLIRLSGALEAMMDPQRLHNFAHAGFIENVALAPRSPWLAEESQVEGYEGEYSAANRQNITMLRYKATTDENDNPIPPPQRLPPPGVSPGWDRMLQNTEHGVEASIGMYGPSVGAQSAEKSGIALQEQKAQGMVGNYHFPDNLARSIQQTGRILLEWIPKIYDTERVARMLGEDGEQELIYLNPDQEQAVMEKTDDFGESLGTIYNLNVGKYDVTVSTGPSYTAKRQEAVANQISLIQSNPELMAIIGDILLKNMDWPEADKISDRLKTLLPPEIQQLEASQDKTPLDPKVRAALAEIEQGSQILEERGAQLQQAEQAINEEAQKVNSDKTEISAMQKELAAGQKVFKSEVQTQYAKLELFGVKLIDQIEEVTDPIAQSLSEQTVEKTEETEEGPQTVMIQDPAMQELIKGLAEMSAGTQLQVAQAIDNSMSRLADVLSQPRETTLIRDDQGNPTGSVTNGR